MKEYFINDLYLPGYRRNFYKEWHNVELPFSFLKCADEQLRKDFTLKTGVNSLRWVCIDCPSEYWGGLCYEKGLISRMRQSITVGVDVFSFDVFINWKSKSDRIYDLQDTDIDCNDIEIWFESLDIATIMKYLYPKTNLPFKLKNPTYELEVIALHTDVEIALYFKAGYESEREKIVQQIDKHIIDFNANSEKKDRKYGVVHNFDSKTTEPLTEIYILDMGSAGFKFFKGLLEFLSTLNCFTKVKVG